MPYQMTYNDRSLVVAATTLGIGMGGFFDGILFHQVLQLHNMQINLLWDGMFHAFTWIMTAVGLWLFWKVMRRTDVVKQTRTFVGSLFLGWGLFNFIEGIIDHYVLQLHHVVESKGLSVFDALFLASGVIFIGLGRRAILKARTEWAARDRGSVHPIRSARSR